MKSNLLRNCFLCLMSLSGVSQAATPPINTEEYVKHIYSAAQHTWPVLENVWDTRVYRKLRLIIADDHNAWAVDANSLTKIPYSEVRQRNLSVEYQHYKKIQWTDDRPTIYVSLGAIIPEEEKARFHSETNPVPSIFTVATHEAFHFFVQDHTWKNLSQENSSRATPYPVLAPPRFYRNSIIRALYASLNGDPDGLGHARYWFDLWKKEYPEEARRIRYDDINEGSAKYIEIAADLIAQGIPFNTREFQKAFIDKIKSESLAVTLHADSESYTIGALSGAILNLKKTNWQSNVARGTPPLDILLENILPIRQQTDSKLGAEINKQANQINTKVGPAIENFCNGYKLPQTIKIFVSSGFSGSYTVNDGFYRAKSVPHDLIVEFSSSARWAGGSYIIKDSIAAQIENDPAFKGKNGYLILYTGKLPPNQQGRLKLKTEQITLDVPYPDDIAKSHTVYIP